MASFQCCSLPCNNMHSCDLSKLLTYLYTQLTITELEPYNIMLFTSARYSEGLMLDSPEELYRWFTNEVMKNLHVVFTMNPSEEGLKDRAATSPALFNR